jgi:hypothetical protein
MAAGLAYDKATAEPEPHTATNGSGEMAAECVKSIWLERLTTLGGITSNSCDIDKGRWVAFSASLAFF